MFKNFKYIILCIVCIFIGIISTVFVFKLFDLSNNNVISTSRNITVTENNTIKDSIDNIYNAVVLVSTNLEQTTIFGTKSITSGSGSGFVYKKDNKYAYILTNHHVVEDAKKITVTTMDGEEVEAKLLGSDEYSDVAVLAINNKVINLVASIGDSTKTELGDNVFTVGSPMGSNYMGSVTKGIISGIGRELTLTSSDGSNVMMQVIQTDAAINPGNSGGPLLNISGQVIGITSSKLSNVEGMGFAIPIEIAMNEVSRLEKGEEIKRPILGVSMLDLNNTYALYKSNINVDKNLKDGAVIIEVQKESGASKGGLKKGDVITAIDGIKVKSVAHCKYLLYKYEAGNKIKITYNRDGKNKSVEVVLQGS